MEIKSGLKIGLLYSLLVQRQGDLAHQTTEPPGHECLVLPVSDFHGGQTLCRSYGNLLPTRHLAATTTPLHTYNTHLTKGTYLMQVVGRSGGRVMYFLTQRVHCSVGSSRCHLQCLQKFFQYVAQCRFIAMPYLQCLQKCFQ